MDDWMILGVIAGFLTTVGFVPQLLRGLQTKHMEDVSLLMPVILGAGMLLWLFYGLTLDNIPIVVWNGIAFALNIGIIALKLKYSGKAERRGTTPGS
ncbi:MAG TPA: SemiSWEET transporter [Methanomassiliicoccales archaeon]|jgi:MtN3 and saliva related transmembrane protein|nr:SemiSWEET transporter [Methanomassiliicoccales archaeon]